jgi:hypothetical protein
VLFAARSTKGIKKLTKDERADIQIDNGVMSAITGMMLSDGHITLRVLSINARFMFLLRSPKPEAQVRMKKENILTYTLYNETFLYCRSYALFFSPLNGWM